MSTVRDHAQKSTVEAEIREWERKREGRGGRMFSPLQSQLLYKKKESYRNHQERWWFISSRIQCNWRWLSSLNKEGGNEVVCMMWIDLAMGGCVLTINIQFIKTKEMNSRYWVPVPYPGLAVYVVASDFSCSLCLCMCFVIIYFMLYFLFGQSSDW